MLPRLFPVAKLLIVLALFLSMMPAMADEPSVRDLAAWLDVQVSFVPQEDPPDSYICQIVVKDSKSGKVLVAPSISSVKGHAAETSSALPGGGKINVTVDLDEAGERASYTIETIDHEEEVVGRQSAVLVLKQ